MLSDEFALNISAGEKLVGIEILDAKVVLGIGKTPTVTLEGLEQASGPGCPREACKEIQSVTLSRDLITVYAVKDRKKAYE